MYARRFEDGPRFRPTSMGIALAVNGGVVAALLLAGPELIPQREPTTLTIKSIPLPEPDPLPSPTPTQPQTVARRAQQPDTTIRTPLPSDNQVWVDPDLTRVEPLPGPTATGVPIPQPVPPPPLFVAAAVDPRYAADFQPDYPDVARDTEREGIVRLRVLIGIDGRVRSAERVSGDDVFWRATLRHALARWRFTPATRGGVPEESWRPMSVRFELN